MKTIISVPELEDALTTNDSEYKVHRSLLKMLLATLKDPRVFSNAFEVKTIEDLRWASANTEAGGVIPVSKSLLDMLHQPPKPGKIQILEHKAHIVSRIECQCGRKYTVEE